MKKFLKYFLIIILSAGLAGGAVWYFLDKKFEAAKKTSSDQIAKLETEVNNLKNAASSTINSTVAPTTDKTAGWKTATDTRYSLSFKYPSTWPDAEIGYQAGEADSPQPISSGGAIFAPNNDYYNRAVEITKYSDYPASWNDKLTIMKNVYNNKSVTGADKLLLPGTNAATMANTAPTYIATFDGRWRGIYYFANIGQDYSTSITCVIQMTDGTNNIVQFFFSQESIKGTQYKEGPGLGEGSPFLTYVSGLTTSSDETVVTNFNEIFQYMAKSLKTL